LEKKNQKLKEVIKELELYKTHYLKQCKFHENDKEEIIKTLQKSFSEDEVGILNIPKHKSRPHPATIKTTQSLVNEFNQSKKKNESIDILLEIFKIDPFTATLAKGKNGQKAIGIAADDMYAILSREKLIDLTYLEFRTALTKKFSQKRSYQKQKAKEIEKNKPNESIILESQTAEIVTDEDDETSSEGNIEESEETDPSDLEDEITNLCGYCNKSFKEKLIPQNGSPNGLGCKACVETEE
jgi:hypothetical protein